MITEIFITLEPDDKNFPKGINFILDRGCDEQMVAVKIQDYCGNLICPLFEIDYDDLRRAILKLGI